jgi:hypothetical protein
MLTGRAARQARDRNDIGIDQERHLRDSQSWRSPARPRAPAFARWTDGEPHLDLGACEAVGNAVEVALDVVVDANLAHVPFGADVGLASAAA